MNLSSTALIAVRLYKNKLPDLGVPESDPMLKQGVQMDMRTARMEQPLKSTTKFNQISEGIAINLDKLSKSKTTYSLRDSFAQQYQPLAGKMVEVQNQRTHLLQEYEDHVKNKDHRVVDLLAKRSQGTISDTTAKAEFDAMSKATQQLLQQVEHLQDGQGTVQKRLNDLYHETYIALPANERPPAIPAAEETLRLGS